MPTEQCHFLFIIALLISNLLLSAETSTHTNNLTNNIKALERFMCYPLGKESLQGMATAFDQLHDLESAVYQCLAKNRENNDALNNFNKKELDTLLANAEFGPKIKKVARQIKVLIGLFNITKQQAFIVLSDKNINALKEIKRMSENDIAKQWLQDRIKIRGIVRALQRTILEKHIILESEAYPTEAFICALQKQIGMDFLDLDKKAVPAIQKAKVAIKKFLE